MNQPVTITRLDAGEPDFQTAFDELVAHQVDWDPEVVRRVNDILDDVRRRGDRAVLEYTARFDELRESSVERLRVTPGDLENAFRAIDPATRRALAAAVERLEDYHRRHRLESWGYEDDDKNWLGQEVRALDRVGVYAPGGKAAYPSSVLMGAVPARVAGVAEIVMVAPRPRGELNAITLAAAHVCGVEEVFSIGGAQAVGALAFGTETIRPVDKIVGPGNVYVATAKRLVFGTVGIDMIAGPSEILVVSDGTTSPDWIAMDLFAQAEHDERARAILISTDGEFLDEVAARMARLLPDMERGHIIRAALADHGALIRVSDLEQAFELVNQVAPEHLELSLENPRDWLHKVRHAGAIFLGAHSAEVLGDYCAGPNHVLPTGGTARFSSPLGVYDFQKRSSVIHCSAEGASRLAGTASVLARGEQLTAHARSAELRIKSK